LHDLGGTRAMHGSQADGRHDSHGCETIHKTSLIYLCRSVSARAAGVNPPKVAEIGLLRYAVNWLATLSRSRGRANQGAISEVLEVQRRKQFFFEKKNRNTFIRRIRRRIGSAQ
jgi:hypothetical protein